MIIANETNIMIKNIVNKKRAHEAGFSRLSDLLGLVNKFL